MDLVTTGLVIIFFCLSATVEVHYTDKEVDNFMQQEITVNMLQLGVAGLPYSGKTTLYDKLIGMPKRSTVVLEEGLSVSELVILDDMDEPVWITAVNTDHEILAMAAALAQICAKKKGLPQVLSMPESSPTVIVGDEECVRSHWRDVKESLRRFVQFINESRNAIMLSTTSLTFLTLWDIGVNKTFFEMMKILAGRCENTLMLNLLSLKRDASETHLYSRMNLKDDHYGTKYVERRKNETEYAVHTTLKYYAANVGIGYWRMKDSEKVILVGTHKDELSDEEVIMAKRRVLFGVEGMLEQEGLAAVVNPVMLAVNTKDDQDVVKVKKAVKGLIRKNKFERKVPIKWLFLRGVLSSSKQVYVSRAKLSEMSRQCGLQGEEELEKWLDLYRSCASILYCPTEEIPKLNENIVVDLPAFIRNLDKLYHVFEDPNGVGHLTDCKDHIELAKYGFISRDLAIHCLKDSKEPDFYLDVLKDLGVMAKFDVKGAGVTAHYLIEGTLPKTVSPIWYFMPSLRQKNNIAKPNKKEVPDMLCITISNGGTIQIHRQAQVVQHLISFFAKEGNYIIERVESCNVVKFKKMIKTICISISVFFLGSEVYINVVGPPDLPKGFLSTRIMEETKSVFSFVKTACIKVLKSILFHIKDLSYRFSILCPYEDCREQVYLSHSQCSMCNRDIQSNLSYNAKLWIEAQSEVSILQLVLHIHIII